jgi:hypothetical protein
MFGIGSQIIDLIFGHRWSGLVKNLALPLPRTVVNICYDAPNLLMIWSPGISVKMSLC